jgi:hypothetical protein
MIGNSIHVNMCNDTMNVICIRIKFIIARLILDVESDQNKTRKTDRKSAYIDQSVDFTFDQITNADEKVVLKHGSQVDVLNI